MPRQIIIDTDPGRDDAVAIFFALASPELDVLAITAVAGNVPLARTERNARALVELAGRPDVPVYAGCERPFVRPSITAEHAHGDTGLHGLDLPEPHTPLRSRHAVDYLIDAIRAAPPKTIALCLLGPATNIAMALVKAPDIAPRIQDIVWMAGARSEGGNVTPAAEYNVYADPEAARVVLAAGAPLTLLPLDLTHQLQLTPARLAQLRRLPGKTAQAVYALFSQDPRQGRGPIRRDRLADQSSFQGDELRHGPAAAEPTQLDQALEHHPINSVHRTGPGYSATEGPGAQSDPIRSDCASGREGAPLHDPCVIAHLLGPCFQGRRVHVAVETDSPLTLGMTVIDWHGVTAQAPNAMVLRQADPDAFFALLFSRLGQSPSFQPAA